MAERMYVVSLLRTFDNYSLAQSFFLESSFFYDQEGDN